MRVIFRGFMFGLSAIAVLALLPLIVRELLQGGTFVDGLLLACFGMGAVGGALLNTRPQIRFHNERITQTAFLAFAASSIALALGRHYIFSGTVLLLAGGSWVVGRALALYQTGLFGGMAGGNWT